MVFEVMLYVDMVFKLHNSIFENDIFEFVDKWLEIIMQECNIKIKGVDE